MRRISGTALLQMIVLMFSVGLYAQVEGGGSSLRFEHLGVKDGLINSNVSSIVQDKQGYLWFGTLSGLDRYDGYEFKEYIYIPFESSSLPHSQIQTMYLDNESYIWIGTYGGLSRLNPETEEFVNFLSDPDDETSLSNPLIISILKDSKGRLWAGTLQGLNLSTDGGKTFKRFYHSDDDPDSIANSSIRSIHEDSRGRIWFGHYGGISIWNEEEEHFINIPYEPDREGGLPGTYVMSVSESADGQIWAGMWEGYISRYDSESDSFESVQLPIEGVYTMMFDSNNVLWIASWTGGLFAMDPDTMEYARYTEDSTNDRSLSNNLAYSLLEDQGGILWVGTRGGGLNKYDPKKNTFFVYQPDDSGISISQGEYSVLTEDSRGYLWLGTHNSGLDRINRTDNSIVNYSYIESDPGSLDDKYIRDVYEDREGLLWVLTQSGLNHFHYDSDNFTRMGAPFEERILNSMIQDKKGNYWIGGYYSGLIVADSNMKNFRYFEHDPEDHESISDNLVQVVYEDSRGYIWLGTNAGLDQWNEGKFIHYRHDPEDPGSISGNKITVIMEDSYGQLWIGTNSGGLNLYDRNNNEFTHFTTRNGLPSNSITAIIQDLQGRMWISTSRGLAVLDPDKQDFVLLDEDDGLISYEMSSASLRASDGSLFIGSKLGIHRIDNVNYINNPYPPQINITRVIVSGVEKSPVPGIDLKLTYKQNFVRFSFAAMDFTAPGKNSYQYRLVGLNPEWSRITRENFAVFSNLDPGRYRFEVKGANNDGVWSENIAGYSFFIQPPWYQSPPAIALSVIFLLIFIVTLINFFRVRWQLSQSRLEEESRVNRLLERKVLERTQALSEARLRAEKADAAKGRFLANISHDIRTPLNSIVGFSEILSKEEFSSENAKYAGTINKESRKLLDLINQIQDISKNEAGKLHIEPEPFDLRLFIDDLTDSYREAARSKGLLFHTEIDENLPGHIVSDKISLGRILENLLGNALKFTGNGHITLSVEHLSEEGSGHMDAPAIRFSVEDSGIGIPEEQRDKIFDSFEQIDKSFNRHYGGSGLGMSIANQLTQLLGGELHLHSSLGEGSRFWFDIPLELSAKEVSSPPSGDSDVKDYNFNSARILLVEDYGPNQDIIRAFLKKCDVHLSIAGSGEEALATLEKERYSLIIMDLHMPGMDGLETTLMIRKSDPDTPILGLTADVIQKSRDNCIAAGMNSVIHKPVQQKILLEAIDLALKGRTFEEFQPPSNPDNVSPGIDTSTDLPGLLAEHDNQHGIVIELARGYISQAGEDIGRLRNAIDNSRSREIHRISHSIKGGALNLMAFHLSQSAGEIESWAKNRVDNPEEFSDEELDVIERRYSALQKALSELRTEIDNYARLHDDSEAPRR